MKSIYSLFAGALCIGASMALIPPHALRAQTSLTPRGGPVIDWGRVEPGMLSRTLIVGNAGHDTITIKGVQVSCGCTAAKIERYTLPPGDTLAIPLTVDAVSFGGPIEKHLLIVYEAPKRDTLAVDLKAYIVQDVMVIQGNFPGIDNGVVGKEMTMGVDVMAFGDDPITLYPPDDLSDSTRIFRCSIDRPTVVAPGQKVRVTVSIVPLVDGTATGDVQMKTTGKRKPVLKIPFYYLALAKSAN